MEGWGFSGLINAVAPGYVQCCGSDNDGTTFAKEFSPQLAGQAPRKRVGEEADGSSAIFWLFSEGAAFVTGSCIKIDGGESLGIGPVFPLLEHQNSKPYRGFHRAVKPKAVGS